MLFLFLPLILFAQTNRTQSVALVPFWGPNDQLIREFGEELYKGVNDLQGYRSDIIDMTNLPDDVPEGGFPPYICPSPSLIKTNPIALTGELTADPDDEEFWHLRLYLWEMADTRLVFSDELTAYDRAECADGLPGMLEWLFGWLKKEATEGEGNLSAPTTGRQVFITTSMPLHWMYIGLRFGWTPLRIQTAPSWDAPDLRYTGNYLDGINAALSFSVGLAPESVPFFSRFGLQLEAVFNYDMGKFEPNPVEAMTLTPGLLLKFQVYRQGNILLSFFGGGYTSMCINDNIGYDQKFPIGWTAGINFGGKLDPLSGIFFVDIRYSSDIFNTYVKMDGEGYGEGFTRNALTISIGYEIGIVKKK